MNEVQKLEIVELGDAKKETRGLPVGTLSEPHPTLHYDKV